MKKLSPLFILCPAIQSLSLAAMTIEFRFDENTPGLEDITRVVLIGNDFSNAPVTINKGDAAVLNIPAADVEYHVTIVYYYNNQTLSTSTFAFTPSDGELFDIPPPNPSVGLPAVALEESAQEQEGVAEEYAEQAIEEAEPAEAEQDVQAEQEIEPVVVEEPDATVYLDFNSNTPGSEYVDYATVYYFDHLHTLARDPALATIEKGSSRAFTFTFEELNKEYTYLVEYVSDTDSSLSVILMKIIPTADQQRFELSPIPRPLVLDKLLYLRLDPDDIDENIRAVVYTNVFGDWAAPGTSFSADPWKLVIPSLNRDYQLKVEYYYENKTTPFLTDIITVHPTLDGQTFRLPATNQQASKVRATQAMLTNEPLRPYQQAEDVQEQEEEFEDEDDVSNVGDNGDDEHPAQVAAKGQAAVQSEPSTPSTATESAEL